MIFPPPAWFGHLRMRLYGWIDAWIVALSIALETFHKKTIRHHFELMFFYNMWRFFSWFNFSCSLSAAVHFHTNTHTENNNGVEKKMRTKKTDEKCMKKCWKNMQTHLTNKIALFARHALFITWPLYIVCVRYYCMFAHSPNLASSFIVLHVINSVFLFCHFFTLSRSLVCSLFRHFSSLVLFRAYTGAHIRVSFTFYWFHFKPSKHFKCWMFAMKAKTSIITYFGICTKDEKKKKWNLMKCKMSINNLLRGFITTVHGHHRYRSNCDIIVNRWNFHLH